MNTYIQRKATCCKKGEEYVAYLEANPDSGPDEPGFCINVNTGYFEPAWEPHGFCPFCGTHLASCSPSDDKPLLSDVLSDEAAVSSIRDSRRFWNSVDKEIADIRFKKEQLLRDDRDDPELTFAAEARGYTVSPIVDRLIELAQSHPKPYVREGAVEGLAAILNATDEIRQALIERG